MILRGARRNDALRRESSRLTACYDTDDRPRASQGKDARRLRELTVEAHEQAKRELGVRRECERDERVDFTGIVDRREAKCRVRRPVLCRPWSRREHGALVWRGRRIVPEVRLR